MRLGLAGSLALVSAMALSLANSAAAWSSNASRTQMDVKMVTYAIEIYRDEVGKYPDPEAYWIQLKNAGVTYLRQTNGPPLDQWKHPLVYRHPGKRGDFDLYSVGPDGIDHDGGLDDISLADVNDGFHWKATWPAGRFVLRLGVGLAIGSCLLALVWPWRFVVPFAGMILCAGIMVGCRLLMHPGVVSDRNQPLQLYISLAALAFGVLLFGLVLGLWKKHFPKNRASPPKQQVSQPTRRFW